MGENMDLPGDTTRDGCAGTLLMQEMRDRITALENDLALYRDFFTESPTGKSMTTPDGGLTRVNTAFCRLLGYTPEELAAMSFTSITHPDDLAESRECVRALLAGECETWHMDKRYIRKGGEVVWAHVTTSLKRDAEGRPLHLRTHVEDLTARKRAEDALRESEATLRAILDATPFPVALVDTQDDVIEYWSRSALTLFGHTAPTATDWYEIAYPDSNYRQQVIDRWKPLVERARLSGETVNTGEYRVTCADGTVRVCELHAAFLADRLVVTFNDITERARAEEALRETEELFSLFMRHSPVYTFIKAVTPTESRVLQTSDNYQHMIGMSGQSMVGKTMTELFPAEFAAKMTADDWAVVSAGVVLSLEEEFGGRTYTTIKFPVFQDDRTLLAGYTIDITERKRAEDERLVLERQFQQSQRLESLGVLAGGIAHDFNNILTSVLGNAELALAELPPAAPARENLLEITQASNRAAALCRQMLAYSGRGHFVIEPIDLSALVEDMLDLLRSTISKKVLLTLDLEKGLPLLEGDPSQLSQVVMNLVINAAEAIGETDGVVAISTGAQEYSSEYLSEGYLKPGLSPGLYLTLEVSDTGCGMDTGAQERIFEPFFTTKFTGRGLGLSAVLGIVRGHMGTLRLRSEPGRGTTFTLLFPAAAVERGASARTQASPTAHWQGEGTILLVDDEETIRAMGARMLAKLGFQVLLAADGREALAVYREHGAEIALILLDLTMPHMDGEETFRELRALDPEVRVVMSSGYSEQDVTSRFVGQGPTGFVQKPYTMALIEERLRAALAD
jgi:two-component system cell cycle sensor histidine kinase/response regulator CckA